MASTNRWRQPLLASSPSPKTPPHPALSLDILISSLGSFSTAYNIVNISLVLVLMDGIYPLSETHKSLCSSTMFAGTYVRVCVYVPARA